MLGSSITMGVSNTLASTGAKDVLDDILFTLGDDGDITILNRSSTLTANTALTNVLEGTPVTPALAANSLIISNITDDGDILIAASDAGNSKAGIHIDGSAPAVNIYNGKLQGNLDANSKDITGVNDLYVTNDLYMSHNGQIRGPNSDNTEFLVYIRDNGASLVAVAGYTGAADPYAWMGGGREFKVYYSGKIELNNALTLNGQVFDAGAADAEINTTGVASGIKAVSTQDGATGARLTLEHISASPASNDAIADVVAAGKDSNGNDVNYGFFRFAINDPTDTSESADFEVLLMNAGSLNNPAFKVDGAGELYADADGSSGTYLSNGVNLFDEYDDVEELRKYQLTIANTGLITEEQRLANRKRMVELGIWDEKDTGSGYMMRFQPMMRLLAGGIWQTRGYIEALERRIEELENRLATA